MSNVDISKFSDAIRQAFGGGGRVQVVIGYNADYAVPVHECITNAISGKTIEHAPPTQAKFLETAMIQGESILPKAIQLRLAAITDPSQIRDAVIGGVVDAAEQIRGNSQDLCPKDTGDLAASAMVSPPEVVA